MWRLRRRYLDVWARLYAPSLSVFRTRIGVVIWSSPLPLRNPPTSVIDRETMSCLRLYHPIGWSPNVSSAPVCERAPSPPYDVSAYTTTSSWSFLVGLLKMSPSYHVGYKYSKTFKAVFRFRGEGDIALRPRRLTWSEISGRVILPTNSSPPIRDWYFFCSAGSSPLPSAIGS